jgi:hypothetical protein
MVDPKTAAVAEQVLLAIESVKLFTRINDVATPPEIEVCRYGKEGEPEIVVVFVVTDLGNVSESEVLDRAVRLERRKAVLNLLQKHYSE